jgi:hypothetical protein
MKTRFVQFTFQAISCPVGKCPLKNTAKKAQHVVWKSVGRRDAFGFCPPSRNVKQFVILSAHISNFVQVTATQ